MGDKPSTYLHKARITFVCPSENCGRYVSVKYTGYLPMATVCRDGGHLVILDIALKEIVKLAAERDK